MCSNCFQRNKQNIPIQFWLITLINSKVPPPHLSFCHFDNICRGGEILGSSFNRMILMISICWCWLCNLFIVTAQPQPQPNSTSTRVGSDKVISWTTPPPFLNISLLGFSTARHWLPPQASIGPKP